MQIRQERSIRLTLQMGSTALEQTLPDERLAQEKLNVLFCPGFGGEALEEHHDFLKVHLDELVGPLTRRAAQT